MPALPPSGWHPSPTRPWPKPCSTTIVPDLLDAEVGNDSAVPVDTANAGERENELPLGLDVVNFSPLPKPN